ncbi:MAG: hypothetical protein NC131_09960 [Roseburia sp.]|nr:hypothetical protein [Roseburia sp.]
MKQKRVLIIAKPGDVSEAAQEALKYKAEDGYSVQFSFDYYDKDSAEAKIYSHEERIRLIDNSDILIVINKDDKVSPQMQNAIERAMDWELQLRYAYPHKQQDVQDIVESMKEALHTHMQTALFCWDESEDVSTASKLFSNQWESIARSYIAESLIQVDEMNRIIEIHPELPLEILGILPTVMNLPVPDPVGWELKFPGGDKFARVTFEEQPKDDNPNIIHAGAKASVTFYQNIHYVTIDLEVK